MGKSQVYRLLGRAFSFCILISFIFAILLAPSPRQITRSDFVTFFAAGQIIRDGKADELYDFSTQSFYQKQAVSPFSREGLLPFRNLPVFAALFIPFTFFPLAVAYKLYGLFLVAVLLFATFLSADLFKNIPSSLLPIAFFLYFPNIITIFWGQSPILFLFLFLYLFKLIKERSNFQTGIAAGLLFLKPQYLIFIPFLLFLVANKKKFLGGFLVSLFLVFSASLLIAGLPSLAKYPSFLAQTEALPFGSRPWQMITIYYLMLSLPNLAMRGKTAILGINTFFYGLALYIFSRKARVISQELAFSAAILFMITFSLHAQVHDTSIVLISLLGILNYWLADKRRKQALWPKIIAITLFVLPMFLLGTFERGVQPASLLYLISGLYLLIKHPFHITKAPFTRYTKRNPWKRAMKTVSR